MRVLSFARRFLAYTTPGFSPSSLFSESFVFVFFQTDMDGMNGSVNIMISLIIVLYKCHVTLGFGEKNNHTILAGIFS